MRALAGRHVLLTGAVGGLGPVVAAALEAAGARVSRTARPEDIGDAPGVHPANLLEDGVPESLVAMIEQRAGPIDVLVNNAGVEHVGALTAFSVAQLSTMTRLNLEIPMRLARAVLPGMLARRTGHVVNMASIAGKGPTPFAASYGATKHGMVGFTRALRAELHGTGVSASAVCPGFVSDRGMYERLARPTGVQAPAVVRTTTSAAVAAAVVRAVQDDVPEILVNPGPMRLMAALGELFPSFGGWLVRAGGITDVQRRWAAHAARTGAQA